MNTPQQQEIVRNLVKFSEQLLDLAEQSVREKDVLLADKQARDNNDVTLRKVASGLVRDTLGKLDAARLVPPENREAILEKISSHEGSLEVIEALLALNISPSSGGNPVPREAMTKEAGSCGSTPSGDPERSLWVNLIRTGWN